jgi:hypothetical protein
LVPENKCSTGHNIGDRGLTNSGKRKCITIGINCVPIIGDGVCYVVNMRVIAYLPRKENTSSETKEKETF